MDAMKKLALISMLFALTAFADEVVTRGAKIAPDAKIVPLAQVLEKPDAYTKDAVVTEGLVQAACSKKGCWMELEGMRVTFKDYGFFVPTDSKGMKARLEGVVTIKMLSKERFVSSYSLATLLDALGRKDEARARLEQASRELPPGQYQRLLREIKWTP